MAALEFEELRKCLTDLRLVSPHQLEECVTRLSDQGRQPDRLLRLLGRRNLLTPYQVDRLQCGSTDDLVLGRYKLLYQNASGSFARVFRACSLHDERTAALKVLRQRWSEDTAAVSLFRREAEVCRHFRHPNIAEIYEIGDEGRHHYFAMEFVEGGTLRDFVRIRGTLPPDEATRCVLGIARGLQYALERSVCHRDLKMTNVLMSADGVAKLVDFGLAGTEEDGRAGLPEQLRQAVEYATFEKGTEAPANDPRSDLFFLGAIYYELLTGVPPFPATNEYSQRAQFSRYSNVRPIRQIALHLPNAVTEAVDRLMHLNPNERYQTPREAASDLERTLSELDQASRSADDDSVPKVRTSRQKATILVVESRTKQQNLLRQHLSEEGLRVLIMSDWHRALDRVRSSPPDCTVVMSDAFGDEARAACLATANITATTEANVILIVSRRQPMPKGMIQESDQLRLLTQPVTLKRLLDQIRQCLSR